MRTALKLEAREARATVDAALTKACDTGVAQAVCITDKGGFPLLIERMDSARVAGPALPGNEAFGIQSSFEGRVPIVVDGQVVGRIGLSGGNGEQDSPCGVAGLAALANLRGPAGHQVEVAADIKK